MERLVTTSQAAELLGLSVQGVHYRIKTKKLKSIKKSGRIFVYIDESLESNNISQSIPKIKKIKNSFFHKDDEYFKTIIQGKDEQITLLKKSVKWMKRQYTSEINRLEKNQKRIIEVFNSEIKLLQSAFNEMRSIYKPQLENIKKEKEDVFITIKDFFILLKRYGKNNEEIKLIILKSIKKGDKRFIYNKKDKKLLILNSTFEDLI